MRALSARVPWQTLRPLVRRHGCLADHRTLREFEDLRHHLVSEGADLDPELLVVRESSDGFGVFAGRAIQKGEVVASVPRRLVLEVPFAVQPRPVEALPFAAAAGGHGQWYDVMGFPAGRAAVTKAAERLIEEYHAGGSGKRFSAKNPQKDSEREGARARESRQVIILHSRPTAQLCRPPRFCLHHCIP